MKFKLHVYDSGVFFPDDRINGKNRAEVVIHPPINPSNSYKAKIWKKELLSNNSPLSDEEALYRATTFFDDYFQDRTKAHPIAATTWPENGKVYSDIHYGIMVVNNNEENEFSVTNSSDLIIFVLGTSSAKIYFQNCSKIGVIGKGFASIEIFNTSSEVMTESHHASSVAIHGFRNSNTQSNLYNTADLENTNFQDNAKGSIYFHGKSDGEIVAIDSSKIDVIMESSKICHLHIMDKSRIDLRLEGKSSTNVSLCDNGIINLSLLGSGTARLHKCDYATIAIKEIKGTKPYKVMAPLRQNQPEYLFQT